LEDKITSKYQSKAHYSEFNMGLYDFERFHEILRTMDDFAWKVAVQDIESIKYLIPYWAVQYVFFINIRAAMLKDKRKVFDDAFQDAVLSINETKNKSAGKSVDTTAHKKLLELHTNLMEMRQLLGLGLVLGEKMTSRQRLHKTIESTQGLPGFEDE